MIFERKKCLDELIAGHAYCSNRKQPSLELLNDIADLLSVSIKDLIVNK